MLIYRKHDERCKRCNELIEKLELKLSSRKKIDLETRKY